MKEVKNLWSDAILQESNNLFPIEILREQAKYFNEKTKNVLVATVKTQQGELSVRGQTKNILQYRFVITAPLLENYSFDVVRVQQEDVTPYPIKIYVPLTEQDCEAHSSEEVETFLSEVFEKSKIISAIQSLLKQSSYGRKEEELPF